jgi:hypothetical protein
MVGLVIMTSINLSAALLFSNDIQLILYHND